jgi:integrase
MLSRHRLVALGPGLARRVKRFADRGRRDSSSDRLFLTLRRGRASGQLDPVYRISRRAGDPRSRSGSRHSEARLPASTPTLVCNRLRRGGNPILLQQILGHSSLAMITQTYQHLTFTDAHDELMLVLAMDMR